MLLARCFSSVLAAFTLSVFAAPAVVAEDDTTRTLTAGDFKFNVAKGMWLIEFFSPFCPHCQKFAPTWKQLFDAHQDLEKSSDFHMAQVNCIASGDVCDQEKVPYYPFIRLYKDGVQGETYSGDRSYDKLTTFIQSKAKEHAETLPKSPPESPPQAALPVARTNANPQGQVLVLTKDTFQSTVDEGPLFVKFYAPWCGHCKKLAPTWVDLASKMKSQINVAEVNCDQHSAVCKSQGVEGYPMIFFYNNGHKMDYRGSRSIDAMSNFVVKAIAPEMRQVKNSDLDSLVKDEKVFYIYLHSLGTPQIDMNKVEGAAKPLMGTPPIVKSSDAQVWSRYNQDLNLAPVIIAIKEGELAGKLTIDHTVPIPAITKWLEENRLPTIDELTSENFQAVMKSGTRSLVVLVPIDTDSRSSAELDADMTSLKNLAKLWRSSGETIKGRGVIFVWMNGKKWGNWLKSMYGVKHADMPTVIVADHDKLIYYDHKLDGQRIPFQEEEVVKVLKDISRGALPFKNSENVVERTMRSAHNKMQALEHFFTHHPLQAVCIALFIVLVIIFTMYKVIQSDTQNYQRPRRLD